MASVRRPRSYHVTLSDEELERLTELAQHAEMQGSQYLRSLIKREWETLRRSERENPR